MTGTSPEHNRPIFKNVIMTTPTVLQSTDIETIIENLETALLSLREAEVSDRGLELPNATDNHRRTVAKLFERAAADTQSLIEFMALHRPKQ
jgi:hypothetical protein